MGQRNGTLVSKQVVEELKEEEEWRRIGGGLSYET